MRVTGTNASVPTVPGPGRGWHRAGLYKTCPHCGTTFRVKPSHQSRRIYCSGKCRGIAAPPNNRTRAERVEKTCRQCGAAFVTRKTSGRVFCEPACRGTWEMSNLGAFWRPAVVVCADCGDTRPRRRNSHGVYPVRCFPCYCRNRAGDRNSNWRGGITPENRRLRNSPEYAAWRLAVFERDGYQCVKCGQRGWSLHADHIKPFAYHPELRLDVSNGRTLCVECHKKTTTYLSGAIYYRPRTDDGPITVEPQLGLF